MNEKPAKGVRGFLLYSPFTDRHFFRVYGKIDPVSGKKTFIDYTLNAEDIEVTIESDSLSLYEKDNNGNGAVDWSGNYLRKNKDSG